MKKSFRQELIAPCGMNCRICIGYFGYTMNGRRRKNTCVGCRLRDKNCAFIKKQCEKLSKKEVEHCFECMDFPCENLEKLDKRYREKYDMSMIKNLEFSDILSAMNGGASYEARFVVVGSVSNEVCCSRWSRTY